MNPPVIQQLMNVRPDCMRRDKGLTLVELMVSIALGMFIVMVTTALFLSTKAGYSRQDAEAHMQEAGRFAVDLIARSVRTASFRDWASKDAALLSGPSVYGLDARSLKGRIPAIEMPIARSVNGSDVLAIRFSGAGSGESGDGTVLNCAGFGVPAGRVGEDAGTSRGWSIFYVAEDATGEPELYCKYRGDDAWTSQAVARGVESFQVLYGLDADDDGLPDQFLNATAMNALDNSPGIPGAIPTAGNSDTVWNKVVAVKFALLIRGANRTSDAGGAAQYELFGKDYADAYAEVDPGVRIREASLPSSARGRQRKIFSATILLPATPLRGAT